MLHKRGMPSSLTAQILFEELSPKPVCDPRGWTTVACWVCGGMEYAASSGLGGANRGQKC
jgi:hypothetical protein